MATATPVLLKTQLKQKSTGNKLEAYIKEIHSDGTIVAYLAGSRKPQVFRGNINTEYSLCMDRATECVLLALLGAVMKPK